MDDFLFELYSETLKDLGAHPRHFGVLEGATHIGEGLNPLCGDRVKIYLQIDADNRIVDTKFEGNGCAISQASASLMTEMLIGRSVSEAMELMTGFVHIARGEVADKLSPEDEERVAPFRTVWKQPMRVKCATLAWHTMKSALEGGAAASSE